MNFKILLKLILFYYYLLINGESKLIYQCQNGFSKFGRDCYYLSVKTATWQEAFFECENLAKGSELVILSRPVDDHNFKQFLKYRKNETRERWIGGIYDWKQVQWKWAVSGQTIHYNKFGTMPSFGKEESDHWQCIALDPTLEYKWTAYSCLQEKYYACKAKPRPTCKNITN